MPWGVPSYTALYRCYGANSPCVRLRQIGSGKENAPKLSWWYLKKCVARFGLTAVLGL